MCKIELLTSYKYYAHLIVIMEAAVATTFIIAAAVIGMLFGFFLASILYSCNYARLQHYRELSQKIIEINAAIAASVEI